MGSNEERGIILLGHPRSGTTLTRRLLNGHSRIASPPETHLLSACVRFLESERTAAGVDIGALAGLNFAGISDENVLNKLRVFAFSFLEDYARREGKARWAEKTAFDAFHIKNIQQFCGDQAIFVGIVRHPLDVAMSSLKFCDSMGFYPKEMHKYICEYPHPIEAFSHSWMDVSQDLIDLSQNQSVNCRIFRYEDLVSSPQSTLSEILTFLDEDFENQLLELGLEKDKVIGFGDHKGYQRKNVHNESVGKWKSLPEYQIQKLAPLLNPMLEHFGYETLKQTKSISVFDARKQYTKGMEIVAQRNYESSTGESYKVESINQTPKHQENKARLSVYGRVTDFRANSYSNKSWLLDSDISNKISASSIDPILLFSVSLLTLLKRIGEDNKLMIGLCKTYGKSNENSVATLPLHITPECGDTFHDMIIKCEQDICDSNGNKITSASPSLDVVLNYHKVSDSLNADECPSSETTHCDNALSVSIIGNNESSNFKLAFDFNDSVWPEQILRDRAVSHFEIILKAAVENIHQKVEGFSLLTEEEGKLLSTLETFDELPPSLIEQFIKQVSQRALHPAVVYENDFLNYQELGMRVFSLSSLLRSKGVGQGKKVAVCLDRSTNLITALLAVMHAGGTYIPIDPDYPQLRISQILEDADPHFVLSDKKLEGRIAADLKDKIFFLDNKWWDPNIKYDVEPNESGELAYIIFTSGSTGRPKGVEVRHHGLNTFLSAMSEKPGMDKNDRLLSVTTISFDIAALELFLPLSVGSTVYLAKRSDTIDGNALKELFVRHKITCFQATPATYRILLANNWTGEPSLKLLCGGEAMPPDLSESLLDKCHSLWNMYGPTETTIWSTIKKVTNVLPVMPIGKAIRGTRTYVLNKEFSRVPIGVPGELFIAGDGIANGYYGRTDLTEKVFVPDPFIDANGAKMYRTGDLVKVLDDGDLVYLGRLDNQVKIRGYRIELGEIETAIKKMPGVEQCVVSVYEQGVQVKNLVAYLILDKSSPEVDISSLRAYLNPLLPDYMIPSFVVVLEALPLTPNNKVDRKALPSPRNVKTLPAVDEPAPNKIPTNNSQVLDSSQSGLEDKIITSWQEIMRIPNISRNDTFVGLGGDSLSYVQVTIGLEEILGVVPENWEKKSIQELSEQKGNKSSQVKEQLQPQLSQEEEKWNFKFADIETSIFIRAAAILSIVFLHALPQWGIYGNTGGLFIVAGFLFAKFQFNQVESKNSVKPILLSAWRIYLPCTIIMGVILLWQRDFRPDVILLYSNFTDPISTYWYVQVLIQILFTMALILAIKPVLQFAKHEPYRFGLFILTIAAIVMMVTHYIEPENRFYRQLPQVRFWQFLIGWCIFFSYTNLQRIATAHILVLLAMLQFVLLDRDLNLSDPIMTIAFGLLLMTHGKITIIKPLNHLIYALAGSSLFIFLTHRQFFELTHYVITTNNTLERIVAFLIAIIGGYLLWMTWELVTKGWRKNRS